LTANAIMPGVLDRYLARTGYKSQQAQQDKPADEPANLWSPADRSGGDDYGAHGRFDDRSTRHSLQLLASQHHGRTAAVALLAAIGAGVLIRRTG
jgi:hypothetical protein